MKGKGSQEAKKSGQRKGGQEEWDSGVGNGKVGGADGGEESFILDPAEG